MDSIIEKKTKYKPIRKGNKTKEKKKRKKNEGSEWTAFLLHQMKNWEMSVMNVSLVYSHQNLINTISGNFSRLLISTRGTLRRVYQLG